MTISALEYVQNILGKQGQWNEQSTGYAFAPTNIALIKYWGKRNDLLNLPTTSTLSITLPDKGCFTQLSLNKQGKDDYWLNKHSVPCNTPFSQRLKKFLDLVRPKNIGFKVETQSNIPIASGLASSACGYAALTLALNKLFSWDLTKQQLSQLARLGSGSACRSFWPGFVEWHAGNDATGLDCYAEPLTEYAWPKLRIGLLITSYREKKVGSRAAMQRTLATSPYYSMWLAKSLSDLNIVKKCLAQHDFALLGKTVESNALALHASIMTAWPPIIYSNKKTLEAMQKIWQLRQNGLLVYFTQDAGSQLKLLFLEKDRQSLLTIFPQMEVLFPFSSIDLHNQVILVDQADKAYASIEKIAAHQQALCHRAFSIFIFRSTKTGLELLIQKRHPSKYHCAGLWTNTCCSHPRPGEDLLSAGRRRLHEELGLTVDTLIHKGSFHYIAAFSNGLTENEVDHVLVGFVASNTNLLNINTTEIADSRWVFVKQLQKELHSYPQQYTPWFSQALTLALQET